MKPTIHRPAGSAEIIQGTCLPALVALEAFLNDSSNPCQNITHVFDADQTSASLSTLLNQICNASCFNTYIDLLNDVSLDCKGMELSSLGINIPPVETMRQLQNLTCLVETGVFCYIELKSFLDTVANVSDANITAAMLVNGCTTCTVDAIRIFLQLGGNVTDLNLLPFARLDLLCMQRVGAWCALELENALAILSVNTTNNTIANLPALCHPCNFHYVNRLKFIWVAAWEIKAAVSSDPTADLMQALQLAQNLSIFLTNLGYACVTDLNGNYCLPQLAPYQPGWAAADCPLGTGSCSTTCKSALKGFVNSVGCCAGTYFHYLEWSCAVTRLFGGVCPVDPVLLAIAIESSSGCDVHIPRGCYAQKRLLSANVTLHNLDFYWCSTNEAACLKLIANEIAYRIGVQDSLALSISPAPANSSSSRRLLQTSTDTVVTLTVNNEDFADISSAGLDLVDTSPGANGASGAPAAGKTSDDQAVVPVVTAASIVSNPDSPSDGSISIPTFLILAGLVCLTVGGARV